MTQVKMENGQLQPLTAQEQADYNAQQIAWEALNSQSEIKRQIMALEATQTLRRMREAANGTDNGWMRNLESQIAALRAQLT